ncbi:MAG: NAD(P)H-dependent oxidoreductase [Gammaproteobacteria bacterium]
MKILAIGTSNSRNSINRTLASYAAYLLEDAEVEVVDINDFEMPLFSVDREKVLGHPPEAEDFYKKIGDADALVVSFAEHNGTYTAAWKNLFDWTSRIDSQVFQGKPALYLSTSPGARGGASVLESAVESAGYFGAELVASIPVPRFQDHFDGLGRPIGDAATHQRIAAAMAGLQAAATQTELETL